MSATERRALLLLLSLGLLGHGVRRWLVPSGAPPGQVELLQALPPKSPLPHRDSILALARPLGPRERIDADRATAAELARLPRVGMALAKRMVAYREAHGLFGGLPALDGVPGVGPGLLGALAEHLSFSGHQPGRRAGRRRTGKATPAPQALPPGWPRFLPRLRASCPAPPRGPTGPDG